MRNAVPASWIPATPVSTATAGRKVAALAPGPMATLRTRASGVATGSGSVAGEPTMSAASAAPPLSSAAAPAAGS